MKRIAALLLALSATAHAQSWMPEQTKMGLALAGLHAIDCLQMREIAKRPDLYHEANPFLPRHPSMRDVNLFCIGSTALGYWLLDSAGNNRDAYLKTGIDLKIIVIGHNHFGVGLRIRL